MDYVRQHVADAVARSRPELAAVEQARLIERLVELVETYVPQRGHDSLKMFAAGESNDFYSHRGSPGTSESAATQTEPIAFVALCDYDGTVTEAIRDGIGLGSRFAPGAELSAFVSPFHLRRLTRLLRAVRQDHASYDHSISVLAKSGAVRLFCSGFSVGGNLILLATSEPLTAPAPSHASASSSKPSTEIAGEHGGGAGRRRLLQLAAHDLRNPVSGILAACQYLLEDATRVLEPHHVLVLGSIESSTRVTLQLIETLAEIPSIGLGKPQLDLQPTDIAAVIHEAASAVRHLAEGKKIKLAVRVKEQVPVFKGDPVRLREALNGILINAMGVSPTGGKIELTLSVSAGEASIAVHRDHSHLAEGTAPASTKSSRRESPRKLSDVHTALLLARARLILKAHGGAVRVEGHGAHGQSWTITLPIAVSQPARKG